MKKRKMKKVLIPLLSVLILTVGLLLTAVPVMGSPGTVGDYVWNDLDHDGIQESNEPGIPDVTVKLTRSYPSLSMTTTTDANGNYKFDFDPSTGDYFVEFVAPAGYVFTLKDQGSDDTVDSDADPTTGKTDVFSKGCGWTDLNWDAGMYISQCGCEGKVTWLKLKYTGADPVFVEVFQKKIADPVFDGPVPKDGEFSFSGVDKKGTLGTEIEIYVNGVFNTKIHTSCSQPIGPGLVSGAFEVVAGTSKDGLLLCPLSGECDVRAAKNLEFKGKKVTWAITNGGDFPLIVTNIDPQYPVANGELKKMKLKDIKPGKTGKLELKFTNVASTEQGKYKITVDFAYLGKVCTIKFNNP